METFHIFLESGAQLVLTPVQEQSIHSILFSSKKNGSMVITNQVPTFTTTDGVWEPKNITATFTTAKPKTTKKSKKNSGNWTLGEDAEYERFLFTLGRIPVSLDFKVLAKQMNRSLSSVTSRWFYKFKGQTISVPSDVAMGLLTETA